MSRRHATEELARTRCNHRERICSQHGVHLGRWHCLHREMVKVMSGISIRLWCLCADRAGTSWVEVGALWMLLPANHLMLTAHGTCVHGQLRQQAELNSPGAWPPQYNSKSSSAHHSRFSSISRTTARNISLECSRMLMDRSNELTPEDRRHISSINVRA